ncbi:hypothetical protein TNCV_4026301 [Trichonephila clavipes]|nr:hypothetical protein TNCV_4026301 [Trichonephila clavipes]
MLEKVIENWTSRLDYIRASHMPEIIFKNQVSRTPKLPASSTPANMRVSNHDISSSTSTSSGSTNGQK